MPLPTPKFEPARWYAIAVAAIALLAYYVTIPEALLVGLVGAILLGGEGVRNAVTPNVKFERNDGDEAVTPNVKLEQNDGDET